MNIIIDLRPLNGGNHSGVEIYLKNLVKTLISEFPQHHFFLFNNSFHPQPQIFQEFLATNSTLIETRLPNKFLNLALSYTKLIKIDQLIQKKLNKQIKFDIFFMPDLRPFQINKTIKSVAVVHDIAFLHFPEFFSLKSRIWYKIIRAKNLFKRINQLISVSDFTKKDLIKTLNLPEKKVARIYPGLPPIEKLENFAKIKDIYNLSKKYFLTLSTIEPRKNLQRIILAFQNFSQKHPEYQLIIAGNSNSQIFQKESLQSSSNIKFIGFIPENHKYQLIKNSQALIYASLFEGFGFPILEAQQAGTNIITSQISSMPEVASSEAILVDPLSINSISQGLENSLNKIISNPINLEKFSWAKTAKQIIQLFETIS